MNPKEIGRHFFRPRFPRGGVFFTSRQIEPIGPSQQDIDHSDAVRGNLNGQEGRIKTPVAITLASLASLGAGGVAGWFVKDAFGAEKPSVTIPVGSFENTFNNSGQQIVSSEQVKTPNKDEVFDNEATSGVITTRMIKRIPQEEIQKLDTFAKLVDDSNKTIVTLAQPKPPSDLAHLNLPDIQVEIRDDKGSIQILYPLDLSKSSNPNAEIEYEKSYSGVTGTDRQAFQGKGYYDTYEFKGKGRSGIPKGTRIRMPVVNGGYLVMSTMGDGLIDVQAPNGNIYRVLIVGGKDGKVMPFKPLVDAPEWTPEFNKGPVGTVGSFAIGGQPFLQTTEKLDNILVRTMGAIKGNIGEQTPQMGTSPIVLTDVVLIVSPEGQLVGSEK